MSRVPSAEAWFCPHAWEKLGSEPGHRVCRICGLQQHIRIEEVQLHASDIKHPWELWYDGLG